MDLSWPLKKMLNTHFEQKLNIIYYLKSDLCFKYGSKLTTFTLLP